LLEESHGKIRRIEYSFIVRRVQARTEQAEAQKRRGYPPKSPRGARRNAPESQQAIADAYTGIGRELGATVVPVGLAWQRFLRQHDRPVLHDKDQSHPTLAGSYLAACVFLAVLFRESPVGVDAEVAGLSEQDRARLQEAAWQECRSVMRERSP
jgi:hypothetical protein